jgi:hypothetical protein
MNLVKFNTNLTCYLDPRAGAAAGSLQVIDVISGVTISAVPITPTGVFLSLSDLVSTKDTYAVSVGAYGLNGESRIFSGMVPTNNVYLDTFQTERSVTSGTQVMYADFEGGVVSGCLLVCSGSSITTSGVINSPNMQGSYYADLTAAANSFLLVQPTGTTTSGLTCGRAIWLTRNSTYSSSTQLTRVPVFALMRQDDTMSSNCYKVALDHVNTSPYNQYAIRLYAENMLTSTSTYTDISTPTNAIVSFPISFSSNAVRNTNRNIWTMVEWQVLPKGVLFNFYYQLYSPTDTIQSVKNSATFIGQIFYTGGASGANYYTSASGVAWVLAVDSNTASVGIDNLSLESLTSLPQLGINSLDVLEREQPSSPTRPLIQLTPFASGIYPPEGILNTSAIATQNPFTLPASGLYGIGGNGYQLRLTKVGGNASDDCMTAFDFRQSTASGITKGTMRVAFQMTTLWHSNSYCPKLGLVFLRQGSALNSNSYALTIENNGAASSWVANLRKGATYPLTPINTSDFTGSVLATTSNLFSTYQNVCVEVRWNVYSPSRTDIEVFFTPLNTNFSTFYESSPGSVESEFTTVLSYSDLSSPYITASASPLLILTNRDYSGISIGAGLEVYQLELRSSKF